MKELISPAAEQFAAAGGRVVTLERDLDNASAARRQISASALADRIEPIEGDAGSRRGGSSSRTTCCC